MLPKKDEITFSTLTPEQVRSDPYLLAIYQALLPKLPAYLTQLRVNRIEKGTFSNGTIAYKIFYGPSSAEDTYCLTFHFDENEKQLIHLSLNEVEKKQYSFDSFFSRGSFSRRNSHSCPYEGRNNAKPSRFSRSQVSPETMKSTFIGWAIKKHP